MVDDIISLDTFGHFLTEELPQREERSCYEQKRFLDTNAPIYTPPCPSSQPLKFPEYSEPNLWSSGRQSGGSENGSSINRLRVNDGLRRKLSKVPTPSSRRLSTIDEPTSIANWLQEDIRDSPFSHLRSGSSRRHEARRRQDLGASTGERQTLQDHGNQRQDPIVMFAGAWITEESPVHGFLRHSPPSAMPPWRQLHSFGGDAAEIGHQR
jgi:hypothetical protein